MIKIYETENYLVETLSKPHVAREDGGHLMITPKVPVVDRTNLSPKLAIEFMRLSMVVGEAFAFVMNENGVNLGRINYQDMGNWSVFKPEGPKFHIHLYGRAKDSKVQKWGDAMYLPHRSTGFYDDFKPLTEKDIEDIRKKIEEIFAREKYQNKNWCL